MNPDTPTLTVLDGALRRGFTTIPNAVIDSTGLSVGARLLYGLLLRWLWYDGATDPGYAFLVERMGASEDYVRKCMNELIAAGLVSSKRRGLGMTNLYVIEPLR